MPKRCSDCLMVKDLSQYYQYGGYVVKRCKSCHNKRSRKWAISNRERVLTLQAERRKGKPNPHPPELVRFYVKQYASRHPDRIKARNILTQAVIKGRILRKQCSICGNPKTQAHHDDYSKPLEVKWLCHEHHQDAHFPARIARKNKTSKEQATSK